MTTSKMDKFDQFMTTLIIYCILIITGTAVYGLIYALATNKLTDILTVFGYITSGLVIFGLVYLAVGKWYPE